MMTAQAVANERLKTATIRWLREAAMADIPTVVRQLELNLVAGELLPQEDWRKRSSSSPNVRRGGLMVTAPLPPWIDCLIGNETFQGLMKYTILARIPRADGDGIHYVSNGRDSGYQIHVDLLQDS